MHTFDLQDCHEVSSFVRTICHLKYTLIDKL